MTLHWKKLGMLFDVAHHGLPVRCVSHAQSPQVLLLEDGIRVYFSTREVDQTNEKYISRVAYAEFSLEFQFRRVSQHRIVRLGKSGCYDEHGIFPFHVTRMGGKVYGYVSGWTRRISVSVDTGIGLAISSDGGETFSRIGDGPVLTASIDEPFLVCDPFVLRQEKTFHMWYIHGTKWIKPEDDGQPERVYKIGHALSTDGICWAKSGKRIVEDSIERECQALPTVAYYEGLYHMVFCFRDAFGFRTESKKGYRLGYASSTDLVNWERDDRALNLPVGSGEWDSGMQCYPHLSVIDNKLHLFYNGNDFGRQGFGTAVLETS